MADSFFGFDTSAAGQGLDDGIDCPIEEEEIAEEEEEYDALNDETFGSEATAGDWERDHEKLAQITESGRLQHHNTSDSKNGIDIDIEDNLSHLVLDEKDGIVPRPGVWDSPPNLPVQRQKTAQTLTSLKNVCTVEELERGLIINRPPPGLSKPPLIQQQQPQHLGGQFLFDSLSLGEQQLNLPPNLLNGLPPPPRFPPGLGLQGPHSVVPPPTLRLPHPQFMQNPRGLPNQTGNMLRYPLPPPHLMIPHGNQRQQPHGTFFPPPPHPSLGPPQFLRPSEHPMLSQFSNNHPLYSHHQQQHHQQQQQQQQQNQQQREHQQHGLNQRKQNRPYQQNDQQGPHQPFFKDNQYPYQNRNNQRYNQQHHHHHSQNMNGSNESGDYDEYAGLMTSREKQWLTNLQLLQHNTNQPYVDDYYYTVFCQRLNKKNENQEQREKKHHNNNGYHRDSKDRDQSQHVFTTKVIYTPTQFENSLGKLQCGSVTAPRKIIDMDVVPNSDPQANPPPQAKETKKTRQRLLEIERLYTIQLKLEDANNPLALLAEQQQQQAEEGEPKPVKKTPRELINALLTSLLQLLEEDKLASILSIRKGKTLLLRFLPYLSVTEYSKQLEELWVGLIRNLPIIGRRDPNLLTRFFPEFHNWLETVHESFVLLRIARSFTESLNHNTKTNSLSFAVTNKFGVSVMASMLEQAESVVFSVKQQAAEWSNFIISLADAIGSSPPSVAPCHPIAANTLNEHLNRIGNLSTERYAPLELLLTDANPSR
ncbi:protein PAT1 homolog 1 isoform X2 [Venturia canescens]|uniref:protein PAT1 homolog 1 isoform X2 n=1 Tax=Venturia canescens TaxID=32260 RepID=UPI001C9CE252|nr:protein PAT1 homolog 1 isoform X2 [Venturia canescens]